MSLRVLGAASAALLIAGPFAAPSAGTTAGAVTAAAMPAVTTTPDLATITRLAGEAYVWGLAPEFTYRFSLYNTIRHAPMNQLTYADPAAWNSDSTNAANSSVVYVNGFTDFTTVDALVLTVPPSDRYYFVVNYLDAYIQTLGSIGKRTTPTDRTTHYLLVGPDSPYAGRKWAVIHGFAYRVMASDTNLSWILVRLGAETLADSSDPRSTHQIGTRVAATFALNSLEQFEANGHKAVYPTTFPTPPPDAAQITRAAPYKETPACAVVGFPEQADCPQGFFNQLGASLAKSPLPGDDATLSGTPLDRLPPWIVPQYNAQTTYQAPSTGQQDTLARFAPIGLSPKGFRVPTGWGTAQLNALQRGFQIAQRLLEAAVSESPASPDTGNWTILNAQVGHYGNDPGGYVDRAFIVLQGGSANVPDDAVYTIMNKPDGNTQLDGNDTYSITFTPPTPDASLPAHGTYPPMVTAANGDVEGFWSVVVYQPDTSEVASPYLPQAAVLNNHFSRADDAVISVDPAGDTVTVAPNSWGQPLEASSAIMFDGVATSGCGLTPASGNGVYYVAGNPVTGIGRDGRATYTFQIASTWVQQLSPGHVPIQHSGGPGPLVDLTCDSPAGLRYGAIRPVSQLGSNELESGQLARNPDGSLTIWLGPSLPSGVPASNWIPTPSDAYNRQIYGSAHVSTGVRVIMRAYYPTPGDEPPSLLPYEGPTPLPPSTFSGSYIPPEFASPSGS